MRRSAKLLTAAFIAAAPAAYAQTAANLIALHGLAPFSQLLKTPQGQAALAANLSITDNIQHNTALGQKGLQDFKAQQAQALKDATITSTDGMELTDALGPKLAAAYQSLSATGMPPSLTSLIATTSGLTAADSAAAKTFFSNGTVKAKPSLAAREAFLNDAGGIIDILGHYAHPASAPPTDPLGDPRPFQTESAAALPHYTDPDYTGKTRSNIDYLYGPNAVQNLIKSPSFPSGHTTYGYTESLLFALLVPQRFPQMVIRGAEYGNSRIILGAHYAMDVIAGRTLATYDLAHLLQNDPLYSPAENYPAALQTAKADLTTALAKSCNGNITNCLAGDTSRFNNQTTNAAFYEFTQTYGLPVVYPANANKLEDVAKIAPEAGDILTAAFPNLTLAQADAILTQTEGPGGGFLDNGSAFGLYSRLDLYKAGLKAETVK